MAPRFLNSGIIDRKLAVLAHWTEHAERVGITFCLENLSEHAGHLAAAFLGLPRLNLTLDLGHAEILSERNASFGFVEQFFGRILHLHLHDNRGGTSVKDDLHLPIGQGTIDFGAILGELKAAGYSGRMCFETDLDTVEQCRAAVCTIWGE